MMDRVGVGVKGHSDRTEGLTCRAGGRLVVLTGSGGGGGSATYRQEEERSGRCVPPQALINRQRSRGKGQHLEETAALPAQQHGWSANASAQS